MKYTREERLHIGGQIYNGELTRYEAAEKYGVSYNTARDYMRMYRDVNNLPPKQKSQRRSIVSAQNEPKPETPCNLEAYESMTKEELILELMKSRIREARLKKGYEVKGDGTVIRYDIKNIR